MGFKNPFLAKLFGQRDGAEAEPQQAAEPQPSPAVTSAPASAAAESPAAAARPQRPAITLPPDHPLRFLWERACRETGRLPEPVLCLEDPLLEAELSRIQPVVDATARERLSRIRSAEQNAGAERAEKPEEKREEAPPFSLDAQAVVFTAADFMTAWLLLYPPVGEGNELDRDGLSRALAEKKVRFGVDDDLLDALPKAPDRYFRLITAARGRPAVQGEDGKVVDLFPRAVERKFAVDEYNQVDYMTLNLFQNVEEGAEICRIIPPTRGEEGKTVTGQPIAARDGREAQVPKGRNTVLSEDGSVLVASAAGHLEFNGRSFQVKPLLDIEGNVDYSTGNINYVGDVCIHGDVCSGFTVRAMGNITVEGVVEACTVEAGGDLVIVKGAQGDNQAVLRAQRSLFAKYLENCCVYVRENLETDCLINCDVYCGDTVTVRSGRMTIIGGRIRAAQAISAGIIGSRAEGRTDISLGGQPCDAFDSDALTRELKSLEQELEQIERQPDSPSKFTRTGRLRMQLIVARKKLEQLEKEQEQIAQEAPESGQRILTSDTVYPNTVLDIDGTVCHIDRELHPCRAVLVKGEILLA